MVSAVAREAHLGVTGGREPRKPAGNRRVRSQSGAPSAAASPTPGPPEQPTASQQWQQKVGVT